MRTASKDKRPSDAISAEIMVAPAGSAPQTSPSKNGVKRGVNCSFVRTNAVFPSCRSPRHSALALPMVSPSGRRWVRMTKLSCARANAQNSALVIGLLRLPRSLLPFKLLEKIEHVRAVFERIVEREDEFRRIAQL